MVIDIEISDAAVNRLKAMGVLDTEPVPQTDQKSRRRFEQSRRRFLLSGLRRSLVGKALEVAIDLIRIPDNAVLTDPDRGRKPVGLHKAHEVDTAKRNAARFHLLKSQKLHCTLQVVPNLAESAR